jgi:hypothetical protein
MRRPQTQADTSGVEGRLLRTVVVDVAVVVLLYEAAGRGARGASLYVACLGLQQRGVPSPSSA